MDKELFLLLETGDLRNIQRLHGQNPKVLLGVTFQGDTPLHIAAREGHRPLVDWILQQNPSLARVENEDGNTPLHEAAKYNQTEVARILLQRRKISAYIFNKFAETPLMIASNCGHLETVELLLNDIEYNDPFEIRLSLAAAAYRGYTAIVNAMLSNPIKPTLHRFRLLLFILLDWYKHTGVADSILDNSIKRSVLGLFRRDVENEGRSPNLHAAVRGGDVDIVQAMLECRAWKSELMKEKDECGRCAIHVAAIRGSWDIITLFLDKMPDCLEIRSTDHKTVLHFAVEYNQFEIVSNVLLNELPEKVAVLVGRDSDCTKNTALHMAAKNSMELNPQLMDCLLSTPSIDVNAVNSEGMTALDIASVADRDNPNCAIIGQKLENAGGIRANFMPKSNATFHSSNTSDSKGGEERDIVNTQIVVASLIATVTFSAVFQIPGGIEDKPGNIHYGVAKMAFHTLFRIFIISDVAAFISSFTVVVAWLIRQLLGDTHLGRTVTLSRPSVVTLLFSIFWTIVTFVSATIIVTISSDYSNLKRKDKKAFLAYIALLTLERNLVLCSALAVGVPLLTLAFVLFTGRSRIAYFQILVYADLSLATFLFLLFIFWK